jgi:hypothetical protein
LTGKAPYRFESISLQTTPWFVADSLLEEGGFEPSVPLSKMNPSATGCRPSRQVVDRGIANARGKYPSRATSRQRLGKSQNGSGLAPWCERSGWRRWCGRNLGEGRSFLTV